MERYSSSVAEAGQIREGEGRRGLLGEGEKSTEKSSEEDEAWRARQEASQRPPRSQRGALASFLELLLKDSNAQ